MNKKIFAKLLIIFLCLTLIGCEKNEVTKDNEKLNGIYNKIGEYFGNDNTDRSNLSTYYIDTEKNIVVVVLADNSNEKQEEFKKNIKVDFEYLKFVKGGSNIKSNDLISVDELNNINNKIIEYFRSDNVEYDNLSFNYVDITNKVVVVGLLNNSKEYQEIFKKLIVNSNLIVFVQGENLVEHNKY